MFEDNGFSGSNLQRPSLEQLCDRAFDGCFEVVLCHAPDRLARRYAYQVLVLEEFARSGIEVVFAKEPERSGSPEDELLRQFQGIVAEYERAQIAERCRRGKLHRARAGAVSVLSNAPYVNVRLPLAVARAPGQERLAAALARASMGGPGKQRRRSHGDRGCAMLLGPRATGRPVCIWEGEVPAPDLSAQARTSKGATPWNGLYVTFSTHCSRSGCIIVVGTHPLAGGMGLLGTLDRGDPEVRHVAVREPARCRLGDQVRRHWR